MNFEPREIPWNLEAGNVHELLINIIEKMYSNVIRGWQ